MTRVPYTGDEKTSLTASLDRHAGHAGILRELIGGSTGDHRRDGPGESHQQSHQPRRKGRGGQADHRGVTQ